MLTWLQRYRLRSYLRDSFWIPPVLAMVSGMLLVRALHRVEGWLGLDAALSPDTARVVLGTLASTLFTFIVFVSSALLVAVQLASSQLTPRVIGLVFRDPVTRGSLALFVFSFTLSVAALVRTGAEVPLLSTYLAGYTCVASLVVFLVLIDHLGRALRPTGALRAVARVGQRVLASVYPRPLAAAAAGGSFGGLGGEAAAAVPCPHNGVVLAFDQAGLVGLARRHDCVIELVPQVGDHVSAGDPLFRVHGGASPPAAALGGCVAVGPERTFEQDPTLAFRILVDIAAKALSPAINDPTTAVHALDQIHHLLYEVARRDLDTGLVHDAGGRLRLAYRTPDWEDFVRLAVTEIRHYGRDSIQVARRLRAMLEHLVRTVPAGRAGILREALGLLGRTAEKSFAEPEDRAQAEVGDLQGVGGRPPEQERRPPGMGASSTGPKS